jgi:hypothetical protein
MLSGYKTYLTALAAALASVAAYASGTIDLPTMIAALFAAAQSANLRNAITSFGK